MERVHLDTDIGGDIDDVCALVMLLKWKDVKITGITTVAEKGGMRAGLVNYVLKVANRTEIPVKSGADVSKGFYKTEIGLQKVEDYWPEPITPSYNQIDEALELLKTSIDLGASIVAIGPYSNLRLLDEKYPGILRKAKLFLMGGYIYPPRVGYVNWGNNMDWNIQIDAASAKYVIENSNPTLVTLPVTLETYLRRAYLKKLRQSGALGNLLAMQAEVFAKDWKNEEAHGKANNNIPNDTINFQYDPMTCAIALGWSEGVEVKEVPLKLEIKDGLLTEIISDTGIPIKVVVKADGNKFSELWLQVVTGSI